MTTDLQEILARSAAYELLSASFLYPEAGRIDLLRHGSRQLRDASLQLRWRELAEALQKLEDHLGSLDDKGLEREYLATFGHTISTDCPPYETEYHQAHVFQKSQTLADLGTFIKPLGWPSLSGKVPSWEPARFLTPQLKRPREAEASWVLWQEAS